MEATWSRVTGAVTAGMGNHPVAAVGAFILVWVSWLIFTPSRGAQASSQLGVDRGCKPAKMWPYEWPFALDMLIKIIKGDREMRLLSLIKECCDKTGNTFEQQLLGGRGFVTIDPRNVEAILSSNFEDYGLGLRIPTFHPLLGSGIFTQDGDAWKASRNLVKPHLAAYRPENFERIQACTQSLIDSVPDDGLVDLQPLFFKLTFETTMLMLFGDTVLSEGWGEEITSQWSSFADAFSLAQDYLATRGRFGQFYWLITDSTFRKACRTTHDFVDRAIAKSMSTINGQGELYGDEIHRRGGVDSFVGALLQQTQDSRELRDHCLNILLAGRDTTGCCLTWTLRLLARHPRVLTKLRDELEGVCGLGSTSIPPTKTNLKQLKYLDLIIKEGKFHRCWPLVSRHAKVISLYQVLRLYPSVPVNSREPIRTTVLPFGGGPDEDSPVLVGSKEGVAYCVYAMHRRKDIYGEDADNFRPERWEADALKNIGYAYLPFNGGRRPCLGPDLVNLRTEEFAMLEVSYAVARLIQVYPYVELPDTETRLKVGTERQRLTLVVASDDGCRVRLNTGFN